MTGWGLTVDCVQRHPVILSNQVRDLHIGLDRMTGREPLHWCCSRQYPVILSSLIGRDDRMGAHGWLRSKVSCNPVKSGSRFAHWSGQDDRTRTVALVLQ